MESIKELRKKIAKSEVDWHTPRHDVIVRRISIYLTWLLLHTPLSANQVTVLQIIVGVIGSLLLIPPHYGWNLLGIFLLQFGYVLDCCDGEVARYRNQSSVGGVFLDLIGHEIVIPFMYVGLAFGEFLRSGRFELLLLGFFAAFFSLRFDISAMFQVVNTLFLRADHPSYNIEKLQSITSHTSKIAKSRLPLWRIIFRYPESMNIITLFLVIDWLFGSSFPKPLSLTYVLLVVFGIMIPIARLLSIYRIFREGDIEKRFREIVQTIKNAKTPDDAVKHQSS